MAKQEHFEPIPETIDQLSQELEQTKELLSEANDRIDAQETELRDLAESATTLQNTVTRQVADLRASIRLDDYRELTRMLTGVSLRPGEHFPALEFEVQHFGDVLLRTLGRRPPPRDDDGEPEEQDFAEHDTRVQIRVQPNAAMSPAFQDLEVVFVFNHDGAMTTMLAGHTPGAVSRLDLVDEIGKIAYRMTELRAYIEELEPRVASNTWQKIVADRMGNDVADQLDFLSADLHRASAVCDKLRAERIEKGGDE